MITITRWVAGGMVLALAAFGYSASEDPVYVGAGKCKNCHKAEKSGNQHGKWSASHHAKAWKALGTEEAQKTGQAKGVAKPQESAECLKCHVTAYGLPPERLGKKFDSKDGVQCETCHGAGDKHVKARLAAAGEDEEGKESVVKIPEGEIVAAPALETCLGCHNSESPTFKSMCVEKVFSEVMHFDPRKGRSEDDLAAKKKKLFDDLASKGIGCGGPEKCETCKKAAGGH